MANRPGCLKSTLLGCGGLLAVLAVVLLVMIVVAYVGRDAGEVRDQVLAPPEVPGPAAMPAAGAATDRPAGPVSPGRLHLDLRHGEFTIRPATREEGLSVEARFNSALFELHDGYELLPDSTWVYHLRFERTISTLRMMLHQIMGGDATARVDVRIPPDVPLALDLDIREGGMEAELGGLWITEADIEFDMGGFSLTIDEPLHEPMESLVIDGSMGGFQAVDLGNASPRRLAVDCSMGGAEVDLSGRWVRDADVRLRIEMGGMAVRLPDGVRVEGTPLGPAELAAGEAETGDLEPAEPEVALPVLRFVTSARMGEMEFRR